MASSSHSCALVSALQYRQRAASSGVSAQVARRIALRVVCSHTEAAVSSNAAGLS